jgi:hypothetical protein
MRAAALQLVRIHYLALFIDINMLQHVHLGEARLLLYWL